MVLAIAALLLSAASVAAPRAKPPFRVLFNNDATNITSCSSPFNPNAGPFNGEHIAASVDEATVKGVHVHLLQPGLGWVPWWQSEVYPMAAHAAYVKARGGRGLSAWDQFVLKGGDVVQLFIDRCRQRGVVPFISFRMNDAHHIFRYTDIKDAAKRETAMGVCRFYAEHPEYRMGKGDKGYEWYEHMQNWKHAEVREYKLKQIEELCRKYDLDGLELDFMRHWKLFRLDETTAKERAAIVTQFVRRVREALDHGAKPGKRRWLCVRVPCYVEMHDDVGIDLPAMVAAGVDMVNLSSHYHTVMDWDVAKIRAALPPQVGLYAEMHYVTTLCPQDAMRRTTPRQFYTAAHVAYSRGADGVSTFNFHYYRGSRRIKGERTEPPFDVFEHLGNRDWLARQPQHYVVGFVYGDIMCGARRHTGRAIRPKVKVGKPVTLDLDLAPPTGGWQKGGRLRMQSRELLGDSEWRATFNGTALKPTADVSEPYPNPYPPALGRPENYRAWLVPAGTMKDGPNHLEIVMAKGKPVQLFYLDLAAE